MPQGFKKNKAQLPDDVKNKKKHKKSPGVKKGTRDIVPKKKKLQEAAKLKKQLVKAIHNKVETDLLQRASNMETKSFQGAMTASSSAAKTKKQ